VKIYKKIRIHKVHLFLTSPQNGGEYSGSRPILLDSRCTPVVTELLAGWDVEPVSLFLE